MAIPDKSAPTVASALFSRWLCRHGLPLEIVSDGGKEFCNEVVNEMLKLMEIKKTTTSPYHPQTNAQVEVCNKTIATYLKTQVDSSTLDWELYMAPMAFAYNTSFHRTIKTSPFTLTFGMEPRTIEPSARVQYGENLSTELFQRMQHSHEQYRQMAREHSDEAITRNTVDHNKKAYPRKFYEGEYVLLEVKNFEGKNRKLSDIYKGPYIIVKVNPNNTVLLKKPSGNHEYLYNTQLIKHYYQNCNEQKKKDTPPQTEVKNGPLPPAKKKKVYEKRPDGGPTTRSKTAAKLISEDVTYAEIVKGKPIKKAGEEFIECHTLINFIKSQKRETPDEEIKKRQLQATEKKEFIRKLNLKQLSDLKQSIKIETELWKKNLVENDWCSVGPKYKLDKFGLPNPQPGVPQPKWVHNRRKFLDSLSFQERNILLTGDPFLEFDPCTYVLIYSYPNQVQNYPAIAQALPHIIQQPQSPGASSTSSSDFSGFFTSNSSPGTSPSTSTYTSPAPSPQPSTSSKSKSSKFFSVPKAVTKVLRSRTVQTTDQPKSTAWIRRSLLKQKPSSGNRAPP